MATGTHKTAQALQAVSPTIFLTASEDVQKGGLTAEQAEERLVAATGQKHAIELELANPNVKDPVTGQRLNGLQFMEFRHKKTQEIKAIERRIKVYKEIIADSRKASSAERLDMLVEKERCKFVCGLVKELVVGRYVAGAAVEDGSIELPGDAMVRDIIFFSQGVADQLEENDASFWNVCEGRAEDAL